jgi:tetratricopeptide (TPR) repeat protein
VFRRIDLGYSIGGFMTRLGALVLALAVTLPATAQAQRRPSNSMHTRSAEVYINNARGTSAADEKQEQLQKALEALNEGAEKDADNPRVWFLLGQVHAMLGNAADADSAFDRAEEMYPEYAKEIAPLRFDVWAREYNAGIAAIQANDMAGAIAKFESADAVYRGRPDALISLGSLYVQAGDLAKAEQAYRGALEVIRGPAREGLDAEQAEAWKQDEEVATTELAALLAETGKAEEAAALYRELLASQPDNAQAKTNLAVTLSRAGQTAEASKLYAELLAQPDLTDIALFNIGIGLYRAEQFDKSAEAFTRALERNPHSPETLYNLGQALVAAAADDDAAAKAESGRQLVEVASRLHEYDPNNRNVIMMLAQGRQMVADAEQDAARAEQLKQELVRTLELADALPFHVSGVAMRAEEGGVRVTGTITNQTVAPGQPIALDFTFVDAQGNPLGNASVSVPAPAAKADTDFEVRFPSDEAVAGWRYTVR